MRRLTRSRAPNLVVGVPDAEYPHLASVATGFVDKLTGALLKGNTVVVTTRFDPQTTLELINAHKVDTIRPPQRYDLKRRRKHLSGRS